MSDLSLKNKLTYKKETILYVSILLILLVVSYKSARTFDFLVLVIKGTIGALIAMIIANSNEKANKQINFIGLGYVIASIYEIVKIVFFGENIFSIELTIIGNIIESIGFIVIINNLNQKDKGIRNTFYRIIYISVCILMLVLTINPKVKGMGIAICINLLILITMLMKYKQDKENNMGNKNIMKILVLKIIYLVCIFLNYLVKEYQLIVVFIQSIRIMQTYLMYKLVMHTNILDVYVKIIEKNKEIEKKSILEEEINHALTEINKIEFNIKEEMLYKENVLKSILESTPNAIAIFDKNSNVKAFNKTFEEILNYNEISIDYFIKNAKTLCQTNKQIEEEIKLNNEKIYKCSYNINYQNEGSTCMLMDITEEKNMLNHLIQLNGEYEELINNVRCPIFIFNEDNIINKSKYDGIYFGDILFSQESTVGILDIFKRMKYKLFPRDLEILKSAHEIDKKAKNNDELYNKGVIKCKIINSEGKILWIECTSKIYYEKDEKYIMRTFEDITEYINTKNYLQKSQNMYKALLNAIPEGIYLEDIDTHKYMFINRKFKNIFNISYKTSDDELGMCRQDLMKVYPGYENVINEGIHKIRHNESFGYKDIKYLDMNNRPIDAKFANIPFKLHDKTFKLTIIKDMKYIKNLEDSRRQIKERIKMDKMKMEFFINISHELKTPLNLIFTSTQLLENLNNKGKFGEANSKISKHVKLTKQNSYRLLKIISDLIDFTKMESGYYKLRMENKDIIMLVEDITMSVVSYAKSKGIQIIFDTEIEELIMNLDVTAIERIVLNILSNAIKFTQPEGIIYVRIFNDNDEVKIEIEDTGIGIKEESINLIFDRFNDVNKGFIGNIYGSGIGLSMVKSMANLIGATVNVESKYGEGTKFTIKLKVEKEEEYEYECTKEEYEYGKLKNIERLIVDMEDIYKNS